jgi:hypothetical protein
MVDEEIIKRNFSKGQSKNQKKNMILGILQPNLFINIDRTTLLEAIHHRDPFFQN